MYRPYKSIFLSWIYSNIMSWVYLLQGIIGTMTLGLIIPNWDMSLTILSAKLRLRYINYIKKEK
jgi:hypothetical protein